MAKTQSPTTMSESEVAAFLDGRHTMCLASHATDGGIHLVAMWYGFLEGHLAIRTYAKAQKLLNVRRNPQVSALIESGDSPSTLRGVSIIGRGVVHEDLDTVRTVSRSVVDRYYDLAAELIDSTVEEISRKRVVIEIIPERIMSWDHRKAG